MTFCFKSATSIGDSRSNRKLERTCYAAGDPGGYGLRKVTV